MSTYKTMSNPVSKYTLNVADMTKQEFTTVTMEISNAPKDEKRLAAEIRRRLPQSLAWCGKIADVIELEGTYRLRTDLFMKLAEFAPDGKNFTKNPIAEKLCEQLMLPELKTRKRKDGTPDDDMDAADDAE